jgi:hypothetical protein
MIHIHIYIKRNTRLTVRLLVTGTGTGTTKLLGLRSSGVGNEEGSVVRDEGLLQLVLGLLINELLVVGNDTLGNSLADGVNLGDMTTTGDANTDVNVGELLETSNEEGLVNLVSEDLGLDKSNGRTVNLEETLTGLDVGNSSGSLLLAEGLIEELAVVTK